MQNSTQNQLSCPGVTTKQKWKQSTCENLISSWLLDFLGGVVTNRFVLHATLSTLIPNPPGTPRKAQTPHDLPLRTHGAGTGGCWSAVRMRCLMHAYITWRLELFITYYLLLPIYWTSHPTISPKLLRASDRIDGKTGTHQNTWKQLRISYDFSWIQNKCELQHLE